MIPSGFRLSGLASVLTLLLLGCAEQEDSLGSDARSSDGPLAAIMDAEDARGRGPKGLDPILEGLNSGEATAQSISVRALGRLEDPQNIGLIAPLLSAPAARVRAEAANALGQTVFSESGDTSAALLHAHLQTEEDPVVLGVIGRTLGRLRYEDPAGIQRAEEALVEITDMGSSEGGNPALLGAVMGLEWLARQNRGRSFTDATRRRLEVLVTHGLPETGPVSIEARRIRRLSLMSLIATRAVEIGVVETAVADPDPDVRRIAVSTLARNPAPSGALELLEEALGDPHPRVRVQALSSYASITPHAQRCPWVLEASQDESDQVAVAALDLLSDPCPEITLQVQRLLAFAEQEDASTPARWHRGAHALVALAAVDPGRASAAAEQFASHANPFARVYGARAAAHLGNVDLLELLAEDPVGNVRTAAVEGLSGLLGHGADEVLLRQLEQDDPQLLLTVVRLLRGTPEAERASDLLLDTFHRISEEKRETARDPRAAILGRIAEMAGPESAEELEPYLEDYDPAVAARVSELLSEWGAEAREASPQLNARVSVPSPEELRELADSRVVLEMEGGGEIEIRLFPFQAPTNAARFARLARAGHFDGLTFHRIVSNFVIQGGSPHANEMSGDGPYTRDEIGLRSNWRGTVGTSTRGRDTGDGQIFINLVDNPRLDHNYTIFAEVVEGMDVVDQAWEGQKILRARVVGPI